MTDHSAQLRVRALTAALCLFASLAATAQTRSPQLASPAFGQALSCAKASPVSFLGAKGTGGEPAASNTQWAVTAMSRIGFPAAAPTDREAASAAAIVAGLLRRGSIVGAKMANDEARRTIPAFASSKFTVNFENLLTVLTQPVGHATYPEAVRAEGEQRTAGVHGHTHGVDLEDSSAALNEIIQRSAITARALGSLYKRPAVLDYMLAQGFRDELALPVAASNLCRDSLSPDEMKTVDISARFMAMPAKASRIQQ
jgi:hypothetical protein